MRPNGDPDRFNALRLDVTKLRDTKLALETEFAQIKMLKERLYNENLALREEVERVCMFEEIVGASPALRAVLSRVSKGSILGVG